jgi:hypothetical protein
MRLWGPVWTLLHGLAVGLTALQIITCYERRQTSGPKAGYDGELHECGNYAPRRLDKFERTRAWLKICWEEPIVSPKC